MIIEEIRRRLQANIDFYNRAAWSIRGVELVAYELAGYIEPAEVLALLPESVQHEIAKIAVHPFPRREDWLVVESVCVERGKMEAYLRAREVREDKQYEGMCKLYEHFTGHKPPGITPGKKRRPRKPAKMTREELRDYNYWRSLAERIMQKKPGHRRVPRNPGPND